MRSGTFRHSGLQLSIGCLKPIVIKTGSRTRHPMDPFVQLEARFANPLMHIDNNAEDLTTGCGSWCESAETSTIFYFKAF